MWAGGQASAGVTAAVVADRQQTRILTAVLDGIGLDKRWNDDYAYTLWTHEWPFSHFFNNKVQNYAGRNHADYSALRSVWLKQA